MTERRPPRITGRLLLLDSSQRLLMVRHAKFWYTPGGQVNPGETIRDGAERELEEETGLKAKPGRLIAVNEWRGKRNHNLEFYFLAQSDQPLPTAWKDTGGPIREAHFFSQSALQAEEDVRPPWLRDAFWHWLANDFSGYDPYHVLNGLENMRW